jgi:hypothetical protein
MRNTCIGWVSLLSVMLLAPGCLVKEVTQTVCLEPGGDVTWIVLERGVRSNEDSAQKRLREEADYFTAALTGRHPAAMGLSRLAPIDVRTTILRAGRPYAVLTEARFTGFETLMETFASNLGRDATSTLERHDGAVTWTLTVQSDSTSSRADEGLGPLIELFDHGDVVLATGHFTSAVGFDLSHDKRGATFHIPEDALHENASHTGRVVLSLTWTEDER